MKFDKVLYKLLRAWNFYNVYNCREVVSEFLTVFENNFIPNPNLRQSIPKFCFTLLIDNLPQEMVFLR